MIRAIPHEVLTGVKKKIGQDEDKSKILEEDLITYFDEDRENQRKTVRENILKAQTYQKNK